MPEVKKVWLDGKFVDYADASVPILTHTLHYGWGAFEGIRFYKCIDGSSAIFRLKEHIDRLYGSCDILDLKIPFPKKEILKATVEVVRKNKLAEGYIRPLVFVGDGAMGLHVTENPVRLAIAAWKWGAYLGDEGLDKGIRAKISSFNRNHINSFMGKAKSVGGYVNSILAKREVVKAGYDEAIMLDTDGYVSEASGENIFIVTDGVIKTTSVATILPGITRATIITLIKEMKMEVREERFSRDELYLADEAFFTGTAAEVTPIREVDDRRIGKGVYPTVKKLQKQYFDLVKGASKKHKDWLTKV